MTDTCVEMMYLGRSRLSLAHPADDVRGMGVVDPTGLRLGEVEDVVIDALHRRARLLSVVSGGVLGLAPHETLLPVEIIVKVDDRVHIDRSHAEVHLHLEPEPEPEADRRPPAYAPGPGTLAPTSFWQVYDGYGVPRLRVDGGVDGYFHRR